MSANQQGGQEDIVDKGVDTAESKLSGGKVDPKKMRSANEQGTDKARDMFEKETGKNVPGKISN